MRVLSRFGVPILLILGLALCVPAARAGQWDHKTNVRFNSSVQLPGTVLSPGNYTFQLLNSPSNRHVVQVFNSDYKVLGTFLTIPVYRNEPAEKPIFVMEERAAGTPEAVKQWFYPGELIGDEFIYSRGENVAVAKSSTWETVAEPASTSEGSAAVTESSAAPSAGVAVHEESLAETSAQPSAAPEETATAYPETEPQATSQESKPAETAPEKTEALPKTASPLPLLVLLGGLSTLAGAAVRRFAKTRAD